MHVAGFGLIHHVQSFIRREAFLDSGWTCLVLTGEKLPRNDTNIECLRKVTSCTFCFVRGSTRALEHVVVSRDREFPVV